MSRNLKGLMFGLIFIFFDIEFNGVDILPDIVGLVVTAIELYALRNLQDDFKKGMYCAAACGILNIVGITSILLWGDSYILLGAAALILDIATVMFTMRGLSKESSNYNTDTMPKKFEASWGVYVGMELLIMFVGVINPIVNIIILAGQVVNYAFMLTLIYSFSKFVQK